MSSPDYCVSGILTEHLLGPMTGLCDFISFGKNGHTKQAGEIKKLLHIAEKLTAALHGLICAKVLSGFQAPVLCVITQL